MKTPIHRFKLLKGYTIFEDGSMIGKRNPKKYLKPQPERGRHKKITAYNYRLYFENGTFEDYSYQQTSSKKQAKTIPVHRLVMETFRPIDEYPPEELKDTWNDVPEEWRRWVRKTALIDHKDDNPSNNHISNLRWSDTLNNSNFRKEREFK
tara:strand:+ start:445 stop:897 length:453 start_codon:yes stop_codon:yes gene_type:complete